MNFTGAGGVVAATAGDRGRAVALSVFTTRANGDVDIMLINKDPSNAYPVTLSCTGVTVPAGAPTVYSYAPNGTTITSASTGTATSQTVPASSIVTIQLHASG